MKLLRVRIISARTCGGLLDDLNVPLRSPSNDHSEFKPLCMIGPNGAGKSQFLQMLAEIFQSILHACVPTEERIESNPNIQFEIEYLIFPANTERPIRVRALRESTNKKKAVLLIQRKEGYDWITCALNDPETQALLPKKIVGYTSGDNETLSLPFLVSRSEYADNVGRTALKEETRSQSIPDTRLMLIDYGTHLEVLVANLLLGEDSEREALLKQAKLQDLHSFRCIIQLVSRKKKIQLTTELKTYIEQLRQCATCSSYDEKTETYTLDYWINEQSRIAFRSFWSNALDLYTAFHKLAMLNDLVLSKKARERVRRDVRTRRFASRLPEPEEDDKVFRFERVRFRKQKSGEEIHTQEVDYVSLSDGEHQLGQLLGIFCMLSSPNVLFLLDEPESHFNPQWRVEFISRVLDIPTQDGNRREISRATQQDCLLTTHAPFIPSDMQRDRVFIFSKDENEKIQIKNPDIETFGATFDTIIGECFGIRPPISQVSRDEISGLMKSEDAEAIMAGIQRLGDSVEKAFLVDHLQQIKHQDGI